MHFVSVLGVPDTVFTITELTHCHTKVEGCKFKCKRKKRREASHACDSSLDEL